MLDYAARLSASVTLLQLLKIIYFAHGKYLARFDRPLIKNEIEAWEHGPVIRVVYEAFKNADGRPLSSRAMRLDPYTNSYDEVRPVSDEADARFIESIFDAFGRIDAFVLSRMTHIPGSPWDEVWNAPDGQVTLGMVIPNDRIRKYFLNR